MWFKIIIINFIIFCSYFSLENKIFEGIPILNNKIILKQKELSKDNNISKKFNNKEKEDLENIIIYLQEVINQWNEYKEVFKKYFDNESEIYNFLNKFSKDNEQVLNKLALFTYLKIVDIFLFSLDYNFRDYITYEFWNKFKFENFNIINQKEAFNNFENILTYQTNKYSTLLGDSINKLWEKETDIKYLKMFEEDFQKYFQLKYSDYFLNNLNNLIVLLNHIPKSISFKSMKMIKNLYSSNNILLFKKKINKEWLQEKKYLIKKNLLFSKNLSKNEDINDVIKNIKSIINNYNELKEIIDYLQKENEILFNLLEKFKNKNQNLFDEYYMLNNLIIFEESIYYLKNNIKDLLVYDFIKKYYSNNIKIKLEKIEGSFQYFDEILLDKLKKKSIEINLKLELFIKENKLDSENINNILDDFFFIKYFNQRIENLNELVNFFSNYNN